MRSSNNNNNYYYNYRRHQNYAFSTTDTKAEVMFILVYSNNCFLFCYVAAKILEPQLLPDSLIEITKARSTVA